MARRTYPASFASDDLRTDYALIVIGVAAALFALIYLMVI